MRRPRQLYNAFLTETTWKVVRGALLKNRDRITVQKSSLLVEFENYKAEEQQIKEAAMLRLQCQIKWKGIEAV